MNGDSVRIAVQLPLPDTTITTPVAIYGTYQLNLSVFPPNTVLQLNVFKGIDIIGSFPLIYQGTPNPDGGGMWIGGDSVKVPAGGPYTFVVAFFSDNLVLNSSTTVDGITVVQLNQPQESSDATSVDDRTAGAASTSVGAGSTDSGAARAEGKPDRGAAAPAKAARR